MTMKNINPDEQYTDAYISDKQAEMAYDQFCQKQTYQNVAEDDYIEF